MTRPFAAATIVALLHALDDAFFGRQPGVPADQHLLAAAISIVLAAGAIVAFPHLRPGVRAAMALSFGVLAIVNGGEHVAHIAEDAPAASDITGVLAAVAGAVLVGLGLAIPFRARGERPGSLRRRWGRGAVALVAGVVLATTVVFPAAIAILQTHRYREQVGESPSAAWRPVSFRAADGLRLSGWYLPSRNRAAVIVVHGGAGDRTSSMAHARLLSRHGYGVLVYDSRGRGESEGSPNAYGWGWDRDVAGALSFIAGRTDVDPERVGALGLSTGADVLIEVAAERKEIRAVVSDGATAASFADRTELDPGSIVFLWSAFAATRVLSGSSPGKPLKEQVARISPTPLLLISAGRGPLEREFNLVYANAAREPVELWDLPTVNHTAAIRERADEYERRMVGFFDRALTGRP